MSEDIIEKNLLERYVELLHKAEAENATLKAQVNQLATFIMENIEGEPSQSEGAIDTAIRIMAKQKAQVKELREGVATIKRLSFGFYNDNLRKISHLASAILATPRGSDE